MNPSKRILLTIIPLTIYSTLSAQEEQKQQVKKMKFSDISIQRGSFNDGVSFSRVHPEKLVPNTSLTTGSFYSYELYKTTGKSVTTMVSFQLGDRGDSNHKANRFIRLGIGYYSGNTSFNPPYFESKSDKKVDSIVSTNNQKYYIDSLNFDKWSLNYHSQQIKLDAAFLLRSNQENRFSLHAGIGLTAGFSISSYTNLYHTKSSGTMIIDSSGYYSTPFYQYYNLPISNRESQKINNKVNFCTSAYIPFGVDFRVGKKNEFWKKIHLFYEGRFNVTTTFIPELNPITSFGKQHNFGIRISVH